MSCPTCDHTMQRLGSPLTHEFMVHYWCPRCGTLRTGNDSEQPMLIERIHQLRDLMVKEVGFHEFDKAAWHQLGINEAINLPANRGAIQEEEKK